MVTGGPNQEITAQAERGFGLDGAFPWAAVQQSHGEAWLHPSGCVEQAQEAHPAGPGQPLWGGGVTDDSSAHWWVRAVAPGGGTLKSC